MELHPFWIIGLTGILALVPVFLGVMTSYLKMSIVFGLIKNALGTQQIPGPLIVSALSFSLTLYVMHPVFSEMYGRLETVSTGVGQTKFSIEAAQKFLPVFEPLITFLDQQSGEREKEFLHELQKNRTAVSVESATHIKSPTVLIPAFMLTELREAFSMGFVVLLPFLVVDLIVANLLTGLGMYMMSPLTISLPLKLILFVSSDAWLFIARGLVQSYGG